MNEIVKNTKFNTIKTQENDLEKKMFDPTTLVDFNQ